MADQASMMKAREEFAKKWDEIRASVDKKGMIPLAAVEELFTGNLANQATYKGIGAAVARGWGKIPSAAQAIATYNQRQLDKRERRGSGSDQE